MYYFFNPVVGLYLVYWDLRLFWYLSRSCDVSVRDFISNYLCWDLLFGLPLYICFRMLLIHISIEFGRILLIPSLLELGYYWDKVDEPMANGWHRVSLTSLVSISIARMVLEILGRYSWYQSSRFCLFLGFSSCAGFGAIRILLGFLEWERYDFLVCMRTCVL